MSVCFVNYIGKRSSFMIGLTRTHEPYNQSLQESPVVLFFVESNFQDDRTPVSFPTKTKVS